MDLCLIGKIVRTHGVNGVCKVFPYSDIPGRFERLTDAFIGKDDEKVSPVRIHSAKEGKAAILLSFTSVTSANDAANLIGMNVYIDASDMAPLPSGRYFVHDLIGCIVKTIDRTTLGSITDVLLLPANDIYVIQTDEKVVLLPAVQEFVKEVDIKTKTVVVTPIPGMFEDTDED